MGAKGRKHARTGMVLPLAALLIVIIALVGWGLLTLGLDSRIFAARKSAEVVARTAADAGISKAVQLMNNALLSNPSWSVTPIPDVNNVALPNSYSNYSYHVSSKVGGIDGYHGVTSVGRSGIAERTINCRLYYASVWFGIGVKESINVKVGATFESPYADLSIRTNSVTGDSILLKAGVIIPGDVIVGPGGDVDDVINIKSTTDIQGDSYAASEPIDFPPVTLPKLTPGDNPVIWDDRGAYTYTGAPIVGSDDPFNPLYIRYNSIEIQGTTATQTIQGHCVIYVEGDMRIKNSAEILIEEPNSTDSSLALYMGGNLLCDNGAGFTNEALEILADGTVQNDTDALRIFGLPTCTTMDLKAKGDYFFGYAYAPDADLRLFAWNEISGAFTGKSLEMLAKVNFIYIPPDNGPQYEAPAYLVTRWWEE